MQRVAEVVRGCGNSRRLHRGKQAASGEASHPDGLVGLGQRRCSVDRAEPASEDTDLEAVAIREELREVDKKDTRVLIQPHPDVLIIPPDPPQLLIKLGQIRTLIQRAHYLPNEAPRRIFILTASSFMKEAANSLLKVLEEPPDTVHVILLAENPGELLPTIRSRCAIVRLGALPVFLKTYIDRLTFSFTGYLRDEQDSSTELHQWIRRNYLSFRELELSLILQRP